MSQNEDNTRSTSRSEQMTSEWILCYSGFRNDAKGEGGANPPVSERLGYVYLGPQW